MLKNSELHDNYDNYDDDNNNNSNNNGLTQNTNCRKIVPAHRKEKIYNEQYVFCLFLQEWHIRVQTVQHKC